MASPGIFSGGGRPGHLNGITRPRRGVAKFHFLKRFKVLENESIFQKSQAFASPKNPFLLRNISKNRAYFTRISELFRKIILEFSIFMII